ncbi:MAG: hypothetical protein KDA65_18990, partial [Planctomycetaceae bacterium]|nr:hypothetical protein [Planctomycetaceae bacterium]
LLSIRLMLAIKLITDNRPEEARSQLKAHLKTEQLSRDIEMALQRVVDNQITTWEELRELLVFNSNRRLLFTYLALTHNELRPQVQNYVSHIHPEDPTGELIIQQIFSQQSAPEGSATNEPSPESSTPKTESPAPVKAERPAAVPAGPE